MRTATRMAFLLVLVSLLLAACGRAPQETCNTSTVFTVGGQEVYRYEGLATFNTESNSYVEVVPVASSPKVVLSEQAKDFLVMLGLGSLPVDFFATTTNPSFVGGNVDWGNDHQNCSGFSKTVELEPYLETSTTANADGSGLGLTTSYLGDHVLFTVKTNSMSPNGGVMIVFGVPKERVIGNLIIALRGEATPERYVNLGERTFDDMQEYSQEMCRAASSEAKMEAIRFRFMASSHEEEIEAVEILVRVLGFVSFDYPPSSMAVLSSQLESGEQVSAHLFTNNGTLTMLPFHQDPSGSEACQPGYLETTSIFDVFEGMVYFVK